MPVPVTDYISTTAPSDTFATHDSLLGKGGYREVANAAARDAVTTERRRAGMLVHTQDDGATWQLGSDLITWTAFSGGGASSGTVLDIEAGENLTPGTPVKVVANQVFAASYTDPSIIGLVRDAVSATFTAKIVTSGSLALTGLTAGSPYFVGTLAITTSTPSSGYVIRVGTAVKSDTLIVNIEEPILLA